MKSHIIDYTDIWLHMAVSLCSVGYSMAVLIGRRCLHLVNQLLRLTEVVEKPISPPVK